MADFQRVVPCDVDNCENQAKYQCLNCEDALCKGCKDKHEKKRQTHKFTLYSERRKWMCKSHINNKNVFWCKTCRDTCCVKCSIASHNGHELEDIGDAIRDKKFYETQHLQEHFQECLTQWKTLLDEAKQMTTGYKDNIHKIDQELIAHAARIHEAVDKVLNKVRKELIEIREEQTKALQAQEREIYNKHEEFKRNIAQLQEVLKINDISLLEDKPDIADMKSLPTLSQQPLPSYIPGQIYNTSIATMIGKLNISIQNFEKKISSNAAPVTGSKELSQQASAPVTPLLSTPVVLSSFNPGYDYPYIACTTSTSLAWVATNQYCIQLMDRDGTALDTIHTDFVFNDVTVTPHGDVLLSGNNRIVLASKKATPKRITVLFSTKYTPCGLCSRNNGDFVVTYYWDHRVIQYSSKGDIIHEFDPELFSNPYRVAVNKGNEDLYVIDTVGNKLLAFDNHHRLRYEYTGLDASSFYPRDVTTDIYGRILITDMHNNRIHVLNKDGEFLQYIEFPELEEPWYIDLDSEGHVWIGEDEGQVKIVKY